MMGERRPWRSLEELRARQAAGSGGGVDEPAGRRLPLPVLPEFPPGVDQLADGFTRREFLKLLAASAALAGAAACERPVERILPYTEYTPGLVPGVAQRYATSYELDGYATGVLVTSQTGRPIKVEGNPRHPASLGAAGVYEQASVLELYDQDRARLTRQPVQGDFWAMFRRSALAGGGGLHILLEPTGSPLIARELDGVRERFPGAAVHFHAPLASDAAGAAARALFGSPLVPHYDFERADVIVALDSDFLASGPFQLRHARQWAARRQPGSRDMSRLYVAETSPSATGSAADHRLRASPAQLRQLAALLYALLLGEDATGLTADGNSAANAASGGVSTANAAPGGISAANAASGLTDAQRTWVRVAAADLRSHAGRCVVLAGERQPASVHAMAYALNAVLGNVGRTTWYAQSPLLEAGEPSHGLARLVAALRAGEVQTLVILGGNPVYASPPELELAAALERAPHRLYCGLFRNETAAHCNWFLPALHYLESWGDARAYNGTVSLVQPLIAPLYGGATVAQALAALGREAMPNAHALLRQTGSGVDAALRQGFLPDSGYAPQTPPPSPGGVELLWRAEAAAGADTGRGGTAAGGSASPAAGGAASPASDGTGVGVEIVLARDRRIHDGRFANNAWLQELPDPISKLTWGNAAELSPALAARLGVSTGAGVAVARGDGRISLPALVVPGQADETVVLRLGYGRAGAESIAAGVGRDVRPLWRAADMAAGEAPRGLVTASPEADEALALTQQHWSMEGRAIALSTTLSQLGEGVREAAANSGPTASLYEPWDYSRGNQWAMAIDLGLCTGCSACVVACQAENNVPVVGAEGVRDSREMHWLRIDRYHSGDEHDPGFITQPMLCQHCEKAPCEYVCPVNATVHSPDGINEMVYNRCVGTRFCSNNCPYKVRRFNWFNYHDGQQPVTELVYNPDVTVRARGVMEKCTFCVQRIRGSEQAARIARRELAAGEVVTACQQACPTEAIVFGSLTNPTAVLQRRLEDPRRYQVLHELGTSPRVQYLVQVTNPNPQLPQP